MTRWHTNPHPIAGTLTEHPPPVTADQTWTQELVLDLTDQQARTLTAHHEAGHLAVGLHHRHTPTGAELLYGYGGWYGNTRWADTHSDAGELLRRYAAGERAADRWLHHQHLWTPTRAWVVETQGLADRDYAADVARQIGAGITWDEPAPGHVCWADIRTRADQLLDQLWPAVQALAAALDQHGRLTGDQARTIAGR